jgi:hypothetical protein
MAPKEAKKCMKASKHKKRNLMQTTMGPTPRKTVSHQAPSIGLKCQMQIVIFFGNNNHFYMLTKSNLNHSHHHRLKSEAILHGQSDLGSGEIDLLTLLSDVNVTPTQIAQIMETLRGPQGGTFMPKHVYNMNQKTKKLHDFATGLLPDSNDAQKTITKLEPKQINPFIFFMKIGLYACSKDRPNKEAVRTRLECPAKIMADLEELRDDFILNEKRQMLVMVSMANDEMIQLVAMYLGGVWFIDTTAGKLYYMNSFIPWIHL